MKILIIVSAVVAFGFCLLGGLVILNEVNFQFSGDRATDAGIGLYFIGKAVFVGTLILVTAFGLKNGPRV